MIVNGRKTIKGLSQLPRALGNSTPLKNDSMLTQSNMTLIIAKNNVREKLKFQLLNNNNNRVDIEISKTLIFKEPIIVIDDKIEDSRNETKKSILYSVTDTKITPTNPNDANINSNIYSSPYSIASKHQLLKVPFSTGNSHGKNLNFREQNTHIFPSNHVSLVY